MKAASAVATHHVNHPIHQAEDSRLAAQNQTHGPAQSLHHVMDHPCHLIAPVCANFANFPPFNAFEHIPLYLCVFIIFDQMTQPRHAFHKDVWVARPHHAHLVAHRNCL